LVAIGHQVDENGNIVIGTNNYTTFIGVKDLIFVYTVYKPINFFEKSTAGC
jgi:mannose-1-phosphate guanylyltransferase